MSKTTHPLWISGQWVAGKDRVREILSPWSQEVVAVVNYADSSQLEEAVQTSTRAFDQLKTVSRFRRSQLLSEIAAEISKQKESFVQAIVKESGKPRKLAAIEVDRAQMTFTLAAEETKRFGGEIVPLDLDATSEFFEPAAVYFRPRGPVLAISPFNFPLNLAAHKVAPALAVGASVILKPPPQAPGAAILLAGLFESIARKISGIPLGAFQVVNASNDFMEPLVRDPRLAILSFTGSDLVGWKLQGLAIRKKVALELGGNAAAIIHEDADILRAAQRCALGAYANAGQVCIKVQRIFVHKNVSDKFIDAFVSETKSLPLGDPQNPNTILGPVIDSSHALRIENWVNEAIQAGAKVLLRGTRDRNLIPPIILTQVPPTQKVCCEEVFGPVTVIEAYENLNEAIQRVNQSRYGLQAGIFSSNISNLQRAISDLDVGGVILNEIPTFRSDVMPYGGSKESGIGREGVRYAMHDFCEPKVVVSYRNEPPRI